MAHSDHPWGGVHAERANYRRENLFVGHAIGGATYRSVHRAPAPDDEVPVEEFPILRPGKTARKRLMETLRRLEWDMLDTFTWSDEDRYFALPLREQDEVLRAWAQSQGLVAA